MSTEYYINELVDIFTGFPLTSKIEKDPEGDISIIQLKDIGPTGVLIKKNTLERFIDKNINQKFFLRDNDIIFKSRSTNHTSTYIKTAKKKTTVTYHYLILRIYNDIAIPEYISWFLNNKNTDNYFLKKSGSRLLHLVTKKDLSKIKIQVPNKEKQAKIVKISSLFKKEKTITKKLLKKKESYIKNFLFNLIVDIEIPIAKKRI